MPISDPVRPVRGVSQRLWIDKAGGRWTKVETMAPGKINFGLFPSRIHAGSRIAFE
ncbi:MAG: hypothetical protein JO108_25560 [Acidobacteriaceae bacterium]|nr:hypothetical protein [Acidobacteriaceae bacterium]